MAETFTPVTLTNDTGQKLNATYFNRLETNLETFDDRIAALEAGSSQKALEDTNCAIWAKSPSPESGLTALSVNASTDDAARIQAMLNYLDTTYPAGATLYLPPGKSNVNTGITLPNGVRIIGTPGKSQWDFWFAGTGTFSAITVNDNDCTPISGLSIGGQQWEANNSGANVTTNTGLNITGQGLTFSDVTVGGFNTGINLVHDNTFIVTFERCSIVGCMVGIDLDIDRTYRGGTPASNAGEKIAFYRSVIANCGTGFLASANGLGLFFDKTSIDFTNVYGRISNSHVVFEQCHLETNYNASPSTLGTDAGTPARYLFDLDGNPRVTMTSCLFILGAGIYTVICSHKGPFNYGVGLVQFNFCNGVQGALHPSAPGGTVGLGYSNSPVLFLEGETTKTVSALFVSRFSLMKVSPAATDSYISVNRNAYITGMNHTRGTLDLALSSAAPVNGLWVEVDL